jgi:hypothetical protein
MTAGIQNLPPGALPAPLAARPAVAPLRLAWLYLLSRRAPAALGLLAGLGALLWAALHWQWNVAGGAAAQQLIPLTIETGAAAVIAVTTHGPFGDPERATGRWLPWLRLATESVLAAHWTTPWIWPARPPHDRGAAICAALVLAAGIAAVTLLGARDSGRRPAPD